MSEFDFWGYLHLFLLILPILLVCFVLAFWFGWYAIVAGFFISIMWIGILFFDD